MLRNYVNTRNRNIWKITKSDVHLGKKVIKVLKFSDRELEGKKFVKEAKILKKFKHENVACLENIGFAPLARLMDYYCFDFSRYG